MSGGLDSRLFAVASDLADLQDADLPHDVLDRRLSECAAEIRIVADELDRVQRQLSDAQESIRRARGSIAAPQVTA